MSKKERTHIEAKDDSVHRCLLCNEYVLRKISLTGRRFGILENCFHIFCIGCLTNRIMLHIEVYKFQSRFNTKELLKKSIFCPWCKAPSSSIMCSTKVLFDYSEKFNYIQQFKKSLLNIECPFIKNGISRCYCDVLHDFTHFNKQSAFA